MKFDPLKPQYRSQGSYTPVPSEVLPPAPSSTVIRVADLPVCPTCKKLPAVTVDHGSVILQCPDDCLTVVGPPKWAARDWTECARVQAPRAPAHSNPLTTNP